MGKYSKTNYGNNNPEVSAKNITAINHSKKPDGFVYILQYGNQNVFKFGVSSNPDRRIKDIDSSSPIVVKELGRFYFKNVYNMEEMIHDNLKSSLIRREWFKLELLSVKAIIEQLKEMSDECVFLTRR